MDKSGLDNKKKINSTSFYMDYRDNNTDNLNSKTKNDIFASKTSEDMFLSDFSGNISSKTKAQDNCFSCTDNENHNEKNEALPNTKPKYLVALSFSLVAVLLIALAVTLTYKHKIISNDLSNYNNFILPVVIQDPKEFKDISEADSQMILESSVWNTVLTKPKDYYNDYDNNGCVIIPLSDVENSAKDLFGTDCPFDIKKNNDQSFLKFDETTNTVHVSPKGTNNSYIPNVQNEVVKDKEIILSVICNKSNNPNGSSEQKKMRYTLKKDVSTNKYYISSVSNN